MSSTRRWRKPCARPPPDAGQEGADLDQRHRRHDGHHPARPDAGTRTHRPARGDRAGWPGPHPNQSGTTERYRRTWGGRPEIKRALFLPAQTAARHNPVLKQAYERLRTAGKKPIVAIVAIMRRLIVIANARLRDAYAQEMKLS